MFIQRGSGCGGRRKPERIQITKIWLSQFTHLVLPAKSVTSEPRQIRVSSTCLAIITLTKMCHGLSKPAWPILLGKHKAR